MDIWEDNLKNTKQTCLVFIGSINQDKEDYLTNHINEIFIINDLDIKVDSKSENYLKDEKS